MSKKRGNELGQQRREEYDLMEEQEDKVEIGVFQRANHQQLAGRRIVTARKPKAPIIETTTEKNVNNSANPFSGFSGLTTLKPSTTTSLQPNSLQQTSNGSLKQTSNGSLQQTSNGSSQKTSNGSSQQTSNGLFQQTSNNSLQQASNNSLQQTSNNSLQSSDAKSNRLREIAILNEDFSLWVEHKRKHYPNSLWTEGLRDYLRHVESIQEKYQDTLPTLKSNSNLKLDSKPSTIFETKPVFSSSITSSSITSSSITSSLITSSTVTSSLVTSSSVTSSSMTSSSSTKPLLFESSPPQTNNEQKPKPFSGFSFMPTPSPSLSNNPKVKEDSTPAFSGFSFQSQTTQPSTSSAPGGFNSFGSFNQTTTTENDDDDENVGREEPTVILKSENDDEDILYQLEKAKLLVYKKESKEWGNKGINALQLLQDKTTKSTRVVMRSSIGKIVLNAALYKGLSISSGPGGKGIGMQLKVDGDDTQFTLCVIRVNAAEENTLKSQLEKAVPQ